MIDARTTAWKHFFPAETSFTIRSGPEPFREAIQDLPGGRANPVLVSWGEHAWEMNGIENYAGIVAINSHELEPADLRRAGFRYIRRFAVLPGMEDPRWFIPLESPRVAASALKINTPFRLAARARHTGARLAARSGMHQLFPDQMTIALKSDSPLDHLFRATLGKDTLHYAIASGTPGPARKPTIAVLDSAGAWLAFAKLAHSQLGKQLIGHEAECLGHLSSHPSLLPAVPRLVFDTELDGTRIVAQTSLPGQMPGGRISARHQQLMTNMERGCNKPANSSGFMRNLVGRGYTTGVPGIDTNRILSQIQLALQGVTIPETFLHGDFTPWNLRLHRFRLTAFDWEYGDIDGLPLVDEIHYRLQAGLMLGDWSEEEAWDHLTSFRHARLRHNYPVQVVHALQMTMLLDMVLRRRAEGHSGQTPHDRIRHNLLRHLSQAMEEDAR